MLLPAYTNENSDNGNQRATPECGASFKQKSPKIILLVWSLFTRKLGKF